MGSQSAKGNRLSSHTVLRQAAGGLLPVWSAPTFRLLTLGGRPHALDGQDRAGWHQSHGCVAAGYVDDRRENGSGEEAVMQREILSKRQVDLNFTRSDAQKPGAHGLHEREAAEAAAYAWKRFPGRRGNTR